MKYSFLLVTCLIFVAGCALPESAYKTSGQPESLLNKSVERVSFSLAPNEALADLTAWIDNDQPTRAELSCSSDDILCVRASEMLSSFGVPFAFIKAQESSSDVVLFYERITASNCENSFVDNRHNFRNLNHPTFGCSVAANILQSVSDHQQFINPALSDLQDAEKAVQIMDAYHNSGTDQ